MKTTIQLNLSKDELAQIIRDEVRALFDTLREQSNSTLGKQKAFFTRKETAEILDISLPTLHKLTKQGLIKSSCIGSSVRYAPQDIEEALVQRKFKK